MVPEICVYYHSVLCFYLRLYFHHIAGLQKSTRIRTSSSNIYVIMRYIYCQFQQSVYTEHENFWEQFASKICALFCRRYKTCTRIRSRYEVQYQQKDYPCEHSHRIPYIYSFICSGLITRVLAGNKGRSKEFWRTESPYEPLVNRSLIPHSTSQV